MNPVIDKKNVTTDIAKATRGEIKMAKNSAEILTKVFIVFKKDCKVRHFVPKVLQNATS